MLTKLMLKLYSVDGALAAFSKAIGKLHKAAELQRAEADRQEGIVAAANAAKARALGEANRALSAASKMEALVG